MRALLVLLATCAALLGAAGSARADWPAAAGTTVIEGNRTGFAFVRLAQPVKVPLDEEYGLGLRLSGSGRLYGVALRQEVPTRGEPIMLVSTHGDGNGYEPSDRIGPWGPFEEADFESGEYVLPAGLYRLYVIADGAPVRAEIAFPGVDGTATFSLDVAVPYKLVDLPRVNSAGPALHTFAGESTLRSEGLVAVRSHVRSDSQVYVREDVCMYGPDDEYEPTTAFGPECGDAGWLVEETLYDVPPWLFFPPDKDEFGFEAVEAWAQPGEWAVGGSIRTVQGSGTNEMFGAWMDYQ
ncbi:MAG TPA: hypothetical protein VG318_14545, partial [Actinomycetota bacterium]|nr:hypothetical protein [Actinomycetota bacterium]